MLYLEGPESAFLTCPPESLRQAVPGPHLRGTGNTICDPSLQMRQRRPSGVKPLLQIGQD